MTGNAHAFDQWIRGEFVALNTRLEQLYFAQSDRGNVEGIGDDLKAELCANGHVHVAKLWNEGNTGDGFDSGFDVLGNVGLYLAALRRHELTNPAREERSPFAEASSLALQVGASIGMAPRFATAHLATHNRAIAGLRKSFTNLPDEFLFIDENTRAILAFQRAADALSSIVPLGVSNPVADGQFAAAAAALREVLTINTRLFENLSVERFFYNVRPYYKPYRVGRQEFRGANAGDFSGINEIDLLLGLARANDGFYTQLLVDKMAFMRPEDQARLRECMTQQNLLDALLDLLDDHRQRVWFRNAARALLEVIELFGATAHQHHDQLVSRFIAHPATALTDAQLEGVTASGPPLSVLMTALETLRDYRCASPRSDLPTRHADVARLRAAVGEQSSGTG